MFFFLDAGPPLDWTLFRMIFNSLFLSFRHICSSKLDCKPPHIASVYHRESMIPHVSVSQPLLSLGALFT